MESSTTASWPLKDIIYVALVGSVMIAAFLEWILWLLAFLYCLVKVYQKANGEGKPGIKILVILNMIFFTAMRCIFLPVMLVTLPLPQQIFSRLPNEMIRILQWFAFYTFAGLLIVPWLFCVFQLVTHDVGRTKRIKTVLDEHSAPKVVICLPAYKETPSILLRAIDSIVDCDYPPSNLHIFLSFDGEQEDDLYLNTIDQLGVPLTLKAYPKSIDVAYRNCRITVSRFKHGGKRSCQKKTFKLINKVYAEYLRKHDDLFLLFIDSDCILDKVCIQNFMYEMELKPGSKRKRKHKMLAMTGVITSTTERNSLLTILQDMEYIHGQLFERSVESGCGAVTCLPGALTILRFSAFRKMAKFYFADKAEQCDDLFDYGKCHLGEDRWLTHLFMIGAQSRYQIQMNTGAFCKTQAVQTFKGLLKQRRRWFLGFITNEACMLTDIRLWKMYPLLVLIRLAQNTIRTTALLFFIMVISILTTPQNISNLPVGFIAVSLGLNWILMMYFGAKLGRYKIMLYPIMFCLTPFLNWLYMVYGICTAGQRTWGGPRADAGRADEKVSPGQAIEYAEIIGDELNVVPETFKPAIEAATHRQPHHAPLMPSGDLKGRFAPAGQTAGGWFLQTNDSGRLYPDMTPRRLEDGSPYSRYGMGQSRVSTDSAWSSGSAGTTIGTPRRVESICDLDNAVAYWDRQAGGAYFEAAINDLTFERRFHRGRPAYARSRASSDSGSSVSMHFNVSSRQPSVSPNRSTTAETPTAMQPARNTEQAEGERGRAPSRAMHQRPRPIHVPPRQRDQSTHGRSPLARRSFTRLATDYATSNDGRSSQASEHVARRHSVDGEGRRGRRSISVDRNGRRRLSKTRRPGRRAASDG